MSENVHDPRWWGWPFFGGHPAARALARHGLVLAPQRETPSAAMTESIAERAERAARRRDRVHKRVEDAEAKRHEFAAELQQRDTKARWRSMTPERRQQMRADVSRCGREAVIELMRRADRTFDLPSDLSEEK